MNIEQTHKLIKNSTFLITGGAGFIGSHIVEYLLNAGAKKVKVLDNLSTGFFRNVEPFINNTAFEFINGDIRDIDTCQKACIGVDFVSHQAAVGSVPRSIKDPITTNDVNISGTLNMLVAARDNNTKRFIYAASSSTYGDSKALPKKEENIGNPLSPYAVTKYVNELYANVFAKTYNMKTIGLRYFNVFGPRQDPGGAYAAVIPLFMDALINNDVPVINGDGTQTRDFTYVSNAVQANINAMFCENENCVNQIYNVACGEKTTLNELFEHIKKLSGSDVLPKYGPARMGDIKDSLADISKAAELLEYKPNMMLKEGLQKTFQWFKEYYYPVK